MSDNSEKDVAQVVFNADTEEQFQTEKATSTADDTLPQPVSTPAKSGRLQVSAAMIIPIWIILSSTVIIYNNYVYNTLKFQFPVFLVTWHLIFAVSDIGFMPKKATH